MTTVPPRVLMIAPTPYFSDRGCHVRIFEEARALAGRGIEVEICTYHLGRDMPPVPVHRIPRIPWYRKRSAGPSWHKPYLDLLLLLTAWRTARRQRPHLIHAHLHEGAFVGWFLMKALRIPLVFDCQGSLSGEMADHRFIREGAPLYRFFRFLEKRINGCAGHVITSSTPLAALLQEQFLLPAERISAVMDGVDVKVFHPRPPSAELRARLGLPEGKRIVVYLGAMTGYQGMDVLLEAIALLNGQSGCHFLLMGYPETEYITKARELGIADHVTFTGQVDYSQAPEYLCLGDMAVSPKLSHTEANGKLLNYLACGLPAVVFDSPVNREILGDSGTYVRFGSASALAEGLRFLATEHREREKLSHFARERAVNLFAWERGAERIETVYRQLLRDMGKTL